LHLIPSPHLGKNFPKFFISVADDMLRVNNIIQRVADEMLRAVDEMLKEAQEMQRAADETTRGQQLKA